MRSFKEVRKVIREFHDIGGVPSSGWRGRIGPQDGQNSLDFNQNLSRLNPGSVDRINSYLGSISSKPYVNPNEAFTEIWNSLHSLGLTFNKTAGDDLRVEGTREYELDLFGGFFGKDGTSYDYTRENMIARKVGYKMALQVTSKRCMDGGTYLNAQIVPMA